MILSAVIFIVGLCITFLLVAFAIKKKRFRALFILLALLSVGISVVSGFAWLVHQATFVKSRTLFTRADLKQLSLALNMFYGDVGRYPTEAEGLKVLIENAGIPGWKGPYAPHLYHEQMEYTDEFVGELQEKPIGPKGFYDYWSHPIRYLMIGAGPEMRVMLISAGPNGKLETDIENGVRHGDDILIRVREG